MPMAAKDKSVFFCNSCGGESAKWFGRCPHCQEWNTCVEEKRSRLAPAAAKAAAPARRTAKAEKLPQVPPGDVARYPLGLSELDGVLGGGIVPGSSVLLGGEPGIGKSTLLLQVAAAMAQHGHTLYISGEESAQQIKQRAERLQAVSDKTYLLAETDVEAALEQAATLPDVKLIILDSIQAVFAPEIESAPGSVSQVRACAAAVLRFAREHGCAAIIVGHVTKEGTLAGPRVLEHMVDTVLYFEGERYNSFRLLRAVKNRFGSTNEIGVFEMGERGLMPFAQPSAYFLSQRPQGVAGSAITCVMQGNRPLLLEVQVLIAKSGMNNPRRLAGGFDSNRLLLLIAMLEQRLGLPLNSRDVYLSVVGGLRVDDPAADLAAAAAITSALTGRAIPADVVVMGETGLLGETRSVSQMERRLKEASAFGFRTAVLPKANKESAKERTAPISCCAARDCAEALKILGLID